MRAPLPSALLGFAAALLLAILPASAQQAQRGIALPPADQPSPWDLYVTVMANPNGAEIAGLSYDRTPDKKTIEADVAALAAQLGIEPPTPKITSMGGIAAAEIELRGLTNWKTGEINLDAIVRAFKRFDRFHVAFMFLGDFPLASSESLDRGPLQVVTRRSGSSVQYDITVDQSAGEPDELPSVNASASASAMQQNNWLWLVVAAIIFFALLVSGIAYFTGRRRALTAGKDQQA